MAIIICPECGKEISDKASTCPNCGYPITANQEQVKNEKPKSNIEEKPKKDKKPMGCLPRAVLIIITAIVLMFVATSILPGDSDSDSEPSKYSISGESSQEQEEVEESTIEESVIYDKNDVVIKATGLESNILNISIENNSKLNLGFNAHAYAVNNIMTGNNIYDMDCDVAAGKNANAELEISDYFLKEFGINTIKTIDILFWAYDNDESFKEFDTGQIQINTNNANDETNFVKGESTLYDHKGVKVEYLFSEDDVYTFCITNTTKKYFNFDVENITFNDYTVTDVDYDLFDETVLKNCCHVFSIKLDGEFKENNKIEDVNKLEFSLKIRPNGDYEDEWSTEMIKYEK